MDKINVTNLLDISVYSLVICLLSSSCIYTLTLSIIEAAIVMLRGHQLLIDVTMLY